jgi:hypothetical protein
VEKIRQYYDRMADLSSEEMDRQEEIDAKLKRLLDAAASVPSLL